VDCLHYADFHVYEVVVALNREWIIAFVSPLPKRL
jgi:hypothetical protein